MSQGSGRTRFLTRLVKEKPLGTASGIAIVIVILVAVLADIIAPYPYGERHLPDRLQGSSAQYLLGTDHLGRDLLSRIIHGARVSLTVGLAATTLNILVAVLIGGTSGFLGGKLDLVVQRFVDAWMSFPGLLLLLTIISIVGKGLLQLILVLGISGGIVGSRVLRSAVIGVKENDYFQSAVAIGASQWKIIVRHVLPNIAAPIIVVFSINVGGVIISEAALSFLGFGLPIEIPSWGGMLSREGRQYMEAAPHLAFWPGLALTVTVYSLNMLGDAVRDLLDPRLIGGAGASRRARHQIRLAEPATLPEEIRGAPDGGGQPRCPAQGMTVADLGYATVRRNPLVADLLHRIDFIDKPRSRKQRYRLTQTGRDYLDQAQQAR